jgi:hypothetical protein
MIRANQARPDEIELYLEPNVGEFSFVAPKEVDEIFERGRLAAEQALSTLRDRRLA